MGGDGRVPASAGSDHGVQLPQDRRSDDGLGLGDGELVLVSGGQVGEPGGVDRVRALRAPHGSLGRQPQARASLPGQFRTTNEGARQLLSWCQAGVLDQRSGGGEPVRVAGLGQDAAAPIADRPVIEVTSPVSRSWSRTLVIRCSVSRSRRWVSSQSLSSRPTPGHLGGARSRRRGRSGPRTVAGRCVGTVVACRLG
jgi:hypothetical protein